MRIAIYPGTFDPITNGHLDILKRSLKLFDKIILAVAKNGEKGTLFPLKERVEMIKDATESLERIEVDSFDCLLVEYAKRKKASVIIRGIRAYSDFEYEFQMALMNRRLHPEIETVFLMPTEQFSYLSSTLIKEIVSLGGEMGELVPDAVQKKLKGKFRTL